MKDLWKVLVIFLLALFLSLELSSMLVASFYNVGDFTSNMIMMMLVIMNATIVAATFYIVQTIKKSKP